MRFKPLLGAGNWGSIEITDPFPSVLRWTKDCAGKFVSNGYNILRDDSHPIAEIGRLVDVVRHQDRGRAIALALPDRQRLLVHRVLGERVARRERLVEQQHGGIHDERPGDRDALFHAAR